MAHSEHGAWRASNEGPSEGAGARGHGAVDMSALSAVTEHCSTRTEARSRREGHGGRSGDGAERIRDTERKVTRAGGEGERRAGKERRKGAGNSIKEALGGQTGKERRERTSAGGTGKGERREETDQFGRCKGEGIGTRQRRGSRAGKPNGGHTKRKCARPPFTRYPQHPPPDARTAVRAAYASQKAGKGGDGDK